MPGQGTLAANMVSDSHSVAHSDVIRLDQPVLRQGASNNKSPMKPHLHERTFNRDAILSALNEGIKLSCSRRSTASGLQQAVALLSDGGRTTRKSECIGCFSQQAGLSVIAGTVLIHRKYDDRTIYNVFSVAAQSLGKWRAAAGEHHIP